MLIVMIYIRGEGIIQDANAFDIYEHRHEVSGADGEYKQVYRLLQVYADTLWVLH